MPGSRHRPLAGAIRRAVVAVMVAAAPAAAQGTVARAPATVALSAGVAFPSGGDLNDTYAPGPYVASTLSIGVVRHLALRFGATWSSFAPAPAPKHTERDSRIGYAGDVSAGAVATLLEHHGRRLLALSLTGGRERVGSTWLNANNVVEPFSHSELWSWGFGAESDLTSHLGLEAQRLTAHRGSRGVVGYIPIGIRVRF